MRLSLVTTLALTFAAALCVETRAQSFELAATPERQNYPPGGDATFTIDVVPKGGYSATVNFRASAPTLPWISIKVPVTMLNAPYSGGFKVVIDAKSGHLPGVHPIIVEGWNGSLMVSDTCYLEVKPTRGWHHFSTNNSPLPNNSILNILVDKSATGWIATPAGITRFDRSNWTNFDKGMIRGIPTGAMALDSSGAIWVGLNDGLAKYADGVWTGYLIPPVIPPDSIEDPHGPAREKLAINGIAIDRNNKIWVTVNGVLAEFDGAELKRHPAQGQIGNGIVVDREGMVWTYGGARYDGKFWSYGVRPGAYQVLFDRDGRMYHVTGGGTIRFDSLTDTRGTASRIPGSATLAIDPRGEFWTGSTASTEAFAWGEGMFRFDGVTTTRYTTYNSGLPDQRVTMIVAGPDGSIWIRTHAGGFELFNPDIASSVAAPHVAVRSSVMTLFPNPASEKATVRLNIPSREHVRVGVHDPLGREIVVALDGAVDAGEALVSIDTEALPAGHYFVRLTTGTIVETRSLTVIR